MGHEKGSDTESRVKHNFGMAKPEGYRKAQRLMRLADRFRLPVVTLVESLLGRVWERIWARLRNRLIRRPRAERRRIVPRVGPLVVLRVYERRPRRWAVAGPAVDKLFDPAARRFSRVKADHERIADMQHRHTDTTGAVFLHELLQLGPPGSVGANVDRGYGKCRIAGQQRR